MIVRRLGNKKKIAHKIINHFPQHKIYMESFFGAGGLFFNKKKALFNFVNDIDNDVFNLFDVVSHNFDEFEHLIEIMPIHNGLLSYWKENQEETKLLRALRFIFLSNFTFYGAKTTMRFGSSNSKDVLLQNLQKTQKALNNVQFTNVDFRKFFKQYSFKSTERDDTFIYNDPPYIGADNNYSDSFIKADSIDLFNCLEETKCKWAMSEFNTPFILEQAKNRKLNVILIGDRTNLKNKRTEILITNYTTNVGFYNYHQLR